MPVEKKATTILSPYGRSIVSLTKITQGFRPGSTSGAHLVQPPAANRPSSNLVQVN